MNFCSRCGDPIEPNEQYCNKCGNYVGNNTNINNVNTQNNQNNSQPINNQTNVNSFGGQTSFQTFNQPNNNIQYQNFNNSYQQNASNSNNNFDKNNKKYIFIGGGSGLVIVAFVIVFTMVFGGAKDRYYFDTNTSTNDNNNEIVENNNSSTKRGKYSTVIVHDNTYSGIKIKKIEDANNLIAKDSTDQKKNCPADIKKVEDEIIKNYGITAVNLCEMDVEFARELGNVFKKVYDEYPSVRGYITNLTLVNVSMTDNYIAAFMPVFNFATSTSDSTYPWVIKTQVLLNTSYFLNRERLNASVQDGSNVGHFPPNATIYSPVAHELGHYLSFLAMMRNYDLNSILLVDNKNVDVFYKVYSDFGKGDFSLAMITEAYEKYKKDTNTTLSMDEWRGTISKYALAKNNSGEYIYDETIAESFHDVYLNGDNAKDASKYVVSVLKEKLGS